MQDDAKLKEQMAAEAKTWKRFQWLTGTVMVGVMVSLTIFWDVLPAYRESVKKSEERGAILALGEKSPSHKFLVTNWVECSEKQAKAECYASIRSMAEAVGGTSFVKDVDDAAKDIGLIPALDKK